MTIRQSKQIRVTTDSAVSPRTVLGSDSSGSYLDGGNGKPLLCRPEFGSQLTSNPVPPIRTDSSICRMHAQFEWNKRHLRSTGSVDLPQNEVWPHLRLSHCQKVCRGFFGKHHSSGQDANHLFASPPPTYSILWQGGLGPEVQKALPGTCFHTLS